MNLEVPTPRSDPQMDNAFNACFRQPPGPLFERYGPSVTERPDGNLVTFGRQGEHAPAPAYAAAIVGGLAVGCTARADFRSLFVRLTEEGAVGVSLQTPTMYDAFHHVEAGHGQVASLAIATNLADRATRPRLTHALVDTGKEGLTGLHYTEPQIVVRAAEKALSGYGQHHFNLTTDDPNELLARSYFDLIKRASSLNPDDKAAWYAGIVRTCDAMRRAGLELEKILGHEAYQVYEAIVRLGPLETGQNVNPRFIALKLPRRSGGRLPENASPSLTVATWRREARQAVADFNNCVENAAFIWNLVRRLQRENPALSAKAIASMPTRDAYYTSAVTENGQYGPTWLRHKPGQNPTQAAILFAAAHALGIEERATEGVRSAAEQYLMRYLPQLTQRGVPDLPEIREGAMGPNGVISTAEFDKFTAGLPKLEEPPKHLVQLATQVILRNAASAFPLAKPPRKPAASSSESTEPRRKLTLKERLPGETGYRPGRAAQERDAWEEWQKDCGTFDTVASSLKEFLGRKYNCVLHLQPDLGYRLATGRLNSEDALLYFLAYHAQLETIPESVRPTLDAGKPILLAQALTQLEPENLPTRGLRELYDNLTGHRQQKYPRLFRGS